MPDRRPPQSDRPPGLLSRIAAKALLALEAKAAPALTAMRHSAWGGSSGGNWWGDGRSSIVLGMPGDDRDLAADAGDLWMNSVVAACLGWLTDQFPEPILEAYSLNSSTGDYEARDTHDLIDLLESPNPAYDSDALFAATVLSYQITGNAYWLKVRNGARTQVLELWHVPAYEMEPAWPDDGSEFISHYIQNVDGRKYKIEVEDVVHFRRGMDPANLRLGLSPLASVIREVATDNEASIYEAAILRNKGIVGVLIQPAEVGDEIEPAERAILEQQFQAKTTGTNRGRALVSSARLDLKEFGRSPGEMGLGAIRNIPASRICAVIGVNEQVLGLTGGKEHNTYENQAAATRGAYNRGLIPMQRSFAKTVTRQLLWADFKGRSGVDYLAWNYDEVAALSEDANARITRAVMAWDSLLAKRGECCEIAGLNPPAPEDDVYKPSEAVAQAVANADARDDGLINESVTGKPKPGKPGDGDDDAADADEVAPGNPRIAKALALTDAHKAGKNGHASPEREDGADPFPRIAGQVASLAGPAGRDGRPTGTKATPFLDPEDDDDFLIDLNPSTPDPTPDPDDELINLNPWADEEDDAEADEANTYNLPTGKPIAEKLKEFFDAQAKDVLGTVRTIGADLGDPATWTALPPIPTGLGDYDRPMAEAMTPLIGAYWDESGKRTRAKLGLDPDEWRVVDPHTRAKIEGAAFAFSKSTNETTSKGLKDALDTLREELAEGIVDRGEALPTLTKRVQGVFDTASKNRAKTIAETEASRAVHQAQLESARQSGVVYSKKLLLSSDACEICQAVLAGMPENGWPLDDAMHDDGKGHPEYSVATMPPIHPRCRCAATMTTYYEVGLTPPDSQPISPVGDEAEPTPEPIAPPVAPPRPTDPIAAARYGQRAANRAAAARGEGAGVGNRDYVEILSDFPDLIPYGPIQDRLKAYTWGDAKVKAIVEAGGQIGTTASLKVERDRLGTDLGRLTKQKMDLEDSLFGKKPTKKVQAQIDAMRAEIGRIRDRRDAIDAEMPTIRAKLDDAIRGILGVESPATFTGADVPPGYDSGEDFLDPMTAPTRANYDVAKAWLDANVRVGDGADVWVKIGEAPGVRAHHDSSKRHIQLKVGQDVGVILHEHGHAIEADLETNGVTAGVRSKQFLEYRVGDERPISLKDKFGGNYKADEMGRKDKFDEAFDERQAYYVGKKYATGGTEILSMGIEKLWNDPVHFAQKDPEYLKWVLGLLDGSLR